MTRIFYNLKLYLEGRIQFSQILWKYPEGVVCIVFLGKSKISESNSLKETDIKINDSEYVYYGTPKMIQRYSNPELAQSCLDAYASSGRKEYQDITTFMFEKWEDMEDFVIKHHL